MAAEMHCLCTVNTLFYYIRVSTPFVTTLSLKGHLMFTIIYNKILYHKVTIVCYKVKVFSAHE